MRAIDLTARRDDRGALIELFRRSWFPGGGPVAQVNLSVSRAGVFRGMHYHRRQADLWCVVRGSAFVGLYDLRLGSPTHGRAGGLTTADASSVLYLPPGVAHGFRAMTDVTLLYVVDAEFSGHDEFGFAWDDPALGIDWPAGDPILSPRDATAPPLAEALADPPRWVDPAPERA